MIKKQKAEHFNKIVEQDEKFGLENFQSYFRADEIKYLVSRNNILNKIKYILENSNLNTAIEDILEIHENNK